MSQDEFARKMMRNIDRTGRTIVGVFPDDGSTNVNDAFVYSVGNSLVGLPELLIVGMYDDTFVINTLSKMMIERGRKFDDGEVVSLGGMFPLIVYDADDTVKDQYTIQATRFHHSEADYEVMQVIIPDPQGLFPWQSDCAAPFCNVVIHRRPTLQ